MNKCKDCGKDAPHRWYRCSECNDLNLKAIAKRNKDKYQYHKQPKGKYVIYKNGALKRNHEFTITIEEFTMFWQKGCYYCGTCIETIGLDRIDNSKGYITGNILACCTTCNFMKHKSTHDSFINKCKEIAIHMNTNT
jgi:hypothetical protein